MGTFAGVDLEELVLRSPRLTLRPWQRSDADRVAEVMRDESMFHFLPLPQPYTHDEAVDFVTKFGDEGRDDGTGIGCAVVETATDRVVGSAALRFPKGRNFTAGEIGYWIAGDARGQGYAAEATHTLLRWGHEHGISRIEILCHVDNLASARSALRAGARFEGLRRAALAAWDGVPGRERASDEAIFVSFADEPLAPRYDAFPPLPPLSDGVIGMRLQRVEDVPGILEQQRDPVTLSWEFSADPHPESRYYSAAARAPFGWITGRGLDMSIVDAETGRFAGTLQVITTFGPPKIGLIGYVVHPEFRGRGYTARALRLFTPWAFEQAGFARLELGAKVDNVASRRSALAGGFAEDGIAERRLPNPDGTYSDEARFAAVNPRYR